MNHSVKFSYKGFEYMPEVDLEYDNKKIFHDVHTPEGKMTFIDWSPYSSVQEVDFKMWVDLGCPKRVTNGPLTREQLLKIKRG